MAIVRHYRLQVAAGQDAALLAALEALAQTLQRIEGFEEAGLLRDAAAPDVYLFSERWSSPDAYHQGAASLPKSAFAALMQTLAAPPGSTSFGSVALGAGDRSPQNRAAP